MEYKEIKLGYCFTGSHCTLMRSLSVMRGLLGMGYDIYPIMSENVYYRDTRFEKAEEFSHAVESAVGRKIIHTVEDAEPLGPKMPLDALVVAPCTGNSMAKLASGITDTAATMAMKAHLRSDRPLLIALASNDALSQNLASMARLTSHRSIYFVPMKQDDPINKPYSLVAELERIPECLEAMLSGKQVRPLFT